jgi:hypothetical protein
LIADQPAETLILAWPMADEIVRDLAPRVPASTRLTVPLPSLASVTAADVLAGATLLPLATPSGAAR